MVMKALYNGDSFGLRSVKDRFHAELRIGFVEGAGLGNEDIVFRGIAAAFETQREVRQRRILQRDRPLIPRRTKAQSGEIALLIDEVLGRPVKVSFGLSA